MPETRSQAKDLDMSTPKASRGDVADSKGFPLSSAPLVPVHKWNLRYDGSSCVREFLERVEELALSRSVSNNLLFVGAFELFEGIALDWLRVNHSSFKTWEELVAGLINEFEVLDYDHRLVAQLRSTFQLPKESLGTFITRILIINKRLNKKLPDADILEILLSNMLPRYIQKLALSPISDIATLKKLGKMIELADCRSDQMRGSLPPQPKSVDNKTVNNKRPFFRNEKPSYKNFELKNKNVNSREEIVCFRCGRPGVKSPDCTCRKSKNGGAGR